MSFQQKHEVIFISDKIFFWRIFVPSEDVVKKLIKYFFWMKTETETANFEVQKIKCIFDDLKK